MTIVSLAGAPPADSSASGSLDEQPASASAAVVAMAAPMASLLCAVNMVLFFSL